MTERIYLHLWILCGILCQGIIATSEKSSDFLVRKRRVINHLPGGLTPTSIEDAKYIVNLKRYSRATCAGAILSHYTVITASICFVGNEDLIIYKIFSGGAYDIRSITHVITSKSGFYGNPPHQSIDGIALVTVDPPFIFSRTTLSIQLYVGNLPEGTLVTVIGWGCNYPPRPIATGAQRRLRSINLPIMNHQECQNDYRLFRHRITEKQMCTYHTEQYCAHTDVGAPLVYNGMLAGIHVLKGELFNARNPDVYINLNRAGYIHWINENTFLM